MSLSERPDTARAAVVSLFVCAGAALFALYGLRPPPPVAADAAAGVFSAERARRHLDWLAAAPRPTGSAAAARARARLIEELRSLGLAPEVDRRTSLLGRGQGVTAAEVDNVLVRILGRERGDAVLLLAHTDSTPQSPGAGDDGIGTVTLLETLRALVAGPPLERDVLALFTDGEEIGLLGAEAFAAHHPALGEIAAVLDFEARGSWGPSLMFETGPGSAGLVRLLGERTRAPAASSVAVEVYRRMPNDTDFTVFRRRGLAGLNFAIQDGLPSYHSPLDTAARLSSRSLQQHGEAALALAQGLGKGPLPEPGEAVFFVPWRGTLVVYPESWALPLAALVALLVVAGIVAGLARRRWTAAGLAAAAGTLLGATVAGGVAGQLVAWGLHALPGATRTPSGVLYDGDLASAAVLLAALAAGLATLVVAGRLTGPRALSAAALLGAALVGLLVAWAAPGGSYLFAWPALAGAVALGVVSARQEPGPDPFEVVMTGIAAVPAVLLWVPFLYLATVALTARAGGGLGAAAVAVVGASVAVPLSALVRRPRRFALGAALGVVLLALVLVVRDRDHVERPRADTLFFARDAIADATAWWSLDRRLDPFTRPLIEAGGKASQAALPPFFLDRRPAWTAPAPALFLPAPALELIALEPGEGGVERLTLRLASGRGAPNLRLVAEVAGEGATVRAIGLGGERAELASGVSRAWLAAYGLIAPRVTFELSGVWTALEVDLADQSWGLPAVGGAPPSRPPGLVAAPSWSSDSTFVYRHYRVARSAAVPAAADAG